MLILRRNPDEVRQRYAPVVGLAVGAAAMVALVAWGRAMVGVGPGPRHLHVLAALLLPFLVAGLAAAADRWSRLLPALAVVLVVGIAGNVGELDGGRFTRGSPDQVLAMAEASLDPDIPRDLRPLGILGEDVTTGWLADGVRNGHIPRGRPGDPASVDLVALRLAFEQPVGPPPEPCVEAAPTGPIPLERGESLQVTAPYVELREVVDGQRVGPVGFSAVSSGSDPPEGPVILRALRPIVVVVPPASVPGSVEICG